MTRKGRKRCWNCKEFKAYTEFYNFGDDRTLGECLLCEDKSREVYSSVVNKRKNEVLKEEQQINMVNGQFSVPILEYRTDTRIEEIDGKTYLIIPSIMNEL